LCRVVTLPLRGQVGYQGRHLPRPVIFFVRNEKSCGIREERIKAGGVGVPSRGLGFGGLKFIGLWGGVETGQAVGGRETQGAGPGHGSRGQFTQQLPAISASRPPTKPPSNQHSGWSKGHSSPVSLNRKDEPEDLRKLCENH